MAAFKEFLNAAGAEIFSSSNAYELLRFRANGHMCHVYRNRIGVLKFVGPVRLAWHAFVRQKAYRAAKRHGRVRNNDRAMMLDALVERDGLPCFYCGKSVAADGAETLEHLLRQKSGGPHHIDNCARAHRRCNERAGHLSLFEKIRLRDRTLARQRKQRRV